MADIFRPISKLGARVPMQIVGTIVKALAVTILAAGCSSAGGAPTPTQEATSETEATAIPTAQEEPTEVEATPTASQEPTETSSPTPTEEVRPVRVGVAVDHFNGIDDNGYNALAWAGVQRAMAEMPGVEGTYLESKSYDDDLPILEQLIADGSDLIITTVGIFFAPQIFSTGQNYPDVKFASVDYSFDASFDPEGFFEPYPGSNHSGLIFAGYLAAGMSETGTVGTMGALDREVITRYMDGYQCGIQYYDEQNAANVRLVGRDLFPLNDTFGAGEEELSAAAGQAAKTLLNQGADVIMPIVGPAGRGVAAAIQEAGALMIGVDNDWYVYAPEYSSIYLTSVVKKVDVAVFETIRAMQDGTFTGEDYVGTLANGGIGLAEFHDVDVPDALSAEVDEVRQGVIDGDIDPSYCLGE